jgi:hypothetical protein
VFCMWHYACKKYKLDTKGLPIGSSLLLICGVAHVKKYKLDANGLSIGSLLLFVCGITHVKSIS